MIEPGEALAELGASSRFGKVGGLFDERAKRAGERSELRRGSPERGHLDDQSVSDDAAALAHGEGDSGAHAPPGRFRGRLEPSLCHRARRDLLARHIEAHARLLDGAAPEIHVGQIPARPVPAADGQSPPALFGAEQPKLHLEAETAHAVILTLP